MREETIVQAPMSDRQMLSRLIEYARAEAEDVGEVVCVKLLTAALLSLQLDSNENVRPESDIIIKQTFAS